MYVRVPLVTGTNTYAAILTPSTNVPFADRKSTTKVFDPEGAKGRQERFIMIIVKRLIITAKFMMKNNDKGTLGT